MGRENGDSHNGGNPDAQNEEVEDFVGLAPLFPEISHYASIAAMFGMFGKNRDRVNRVFAWVIGILVIASMIMAYFSLLV